MAGQAPLDPSVTLDDATSAIYAAFPVEEEGTASTFRALKDVFTAEGLPAAPWTRGQTLRALPLNACVQAPQGQPQQLKRTIDVLQKTGQSHLPTTGLGAADAAP